MSPNLRVAQKTLPYPLWAAAFDPSNHDFLLVGGGGGSTSSGVPNKITLLDVSRPGTINEVIDLDLAKDEDSVTSLAIAESDAQSLIAYAGINSSVKDQEKGKNEHFRSFRIGLPSRKRTAAGDEKQDETAQTSKIRSEALARTAFFRPAKGPKSETYQRKLRVASTKGGIRVGAIASGLATQNEVITFKAIPSPGSSQLISRINLESDEAADLDIIAAGDGKDTTALAYCTDHEVYIQRIPANGKNIKEPIKVLSGTKSAQASKIKCIRWLNARYLVLVKNRAGRTGCDLEILKTDREYTQAQVVRVKRLDKATKSAVGLDTCELSANPEGDQQFVIGVVGQDCSIEILAVDYTSGSGISKIKQFTRLREVQPGPITGISISKFTPPTLPTTKETRPQYIRMASVSASNVVVVNTIPLRPYPASKNPRYLLIPPPETVQNAINIFTALLIIGMSALCMQIFCELRGAVPPLLNAQDWLTPKWQQRIARPYIFSNKGGPVIPESMPTINVADKTQLDPASQASEITSNFLANLLNLDETKEKQIVLRDDTHNPDNKLDLATELHEVGAETLEKLKEQSIKKWDDLTHAEKRGWKDKLKAAGHWTEAEGEKILKGILFSELAGVVGAAMHG